MGFKRRRNVSELRALLMGKKWSDFKLRRANGLSMPKYRRHDLTFGKCRTLCSNDIFFSANIEKHYEKPALTVKAQGQYVVLKFLSKADLQSINRTPITDIPLFEWKHLDGLGPVVSNEPL